MLQLHVEFLLLLGQAMDRRWPPRHGLQGSTEATILCRLGRPNQPQSLARNAQGAVSQSEHHPPSPLQAMCGLNKMTTWQANSLKCQCLSAHVRAVRWWTMPLPKQAPLGIGRPCPTLAKTRRRTPDLSCGESRTWGASKGTLCRLAAGRAACARRRRPKTWTYCTCCPTCQNKERWGQLLRRLGAQLKRQVCLLLR